MRVIRLDTPQEGLDVEHLAQLHHEEFGGSREFNVEAVTRACVKCVLDNERRYFNCWIAYDDKSLPIGYLAATLSESFYSFRSYAIQEMWYVIPRMRGTRAGIMLLNAYEGWAIKRDCERIYTQVEHDGALALTETIFGMLNKLGYRKQGYIAVKSFQHEDKDDDNDRTTHRAMGAQQAQV